MTEDAQLKLRLPIQLKEFIEEEAKKNHRTINGEVIYRLERSRINSEQMSQADIRVIHLANGKKRLVYGKFSKTLGLDYSQDLNSIKTDIELSLDALSRSSFSHRISMFNKDILVYKGNNHIDIVDNGKGSLGWLRIEDHDM